MRLNRFITGTNIILVILVAIGSFSLSYSALSDLASKNGFADWRAYVLPLVIDIGMLTFGLAVVHAHLHSTNPLRRRLLNLLYTGATVIFNIVHAPSNLLAQGLAIIPPLTLFFTFEVLMAMVEYNIKRSQQQATIAGYDNALQIAQNGFTDLMQQVEVIKAQYQADIVKRDNQLADLNTRLESALDPVGTRRKAIINTLQADPMTTYKALADEHQVSTQTIQSDLVKLTEAGAIHRNGNGWVVTQ